MKDNIKNQKGITLIALVITTIILVIIAGISIGELSKNKNSLNESKDTTAMSELTKIQQAAIERHIKYKQFGDASVFVGEILDYNTARDYISQFTDNKEQLKVGELDDPEYVYYKLTTKDLTELGLDNIHNEDQFMVNYLSGEVLNITKKANNKDIVFYIYARDSLITS